MKTRLTCAAMASIGTSLLLLAGIRCTQAAEIKIVSPSAYKDVEGCCGTVPEGALSPFRYQLVFPAEDFAAKLGNQPHWLVDITIRPDEITSPRTVVYPDNQWRLTTTQVGSDNLSSRFDDNLGSDSKDWYPEGPLTLTADSGPGPGPREFYNADRPAGVTPYLYDPSQGNLLLDWIAWQGASPSPRADWITGMETALIGSPFEPDGSFIPVIVHQFTLIPVTPGDYNRDGTVDAADYVVWRHGLGTTYTPADYDVWRANFGQTIGSGAALPSADRLPIGVPEPATLTLLIMAVVVHYARRRSTVS
jgi:hypothetical protein